MEEKIVSVLNEMSEYLSISQMKKLQEVIIRTFAENEASKTDISNDDFLKMFLDAKQIEGCSERTIQYYRVTVEHLLSQTETNIRKITTEEMRDYLSDYQKRNNCNVQARKPVRIGCTRQRRPGASFLTWGRRRHIVGLREQGGVTHGVSITPRSPDRLVSKQQWG